MAGYSVRSLVDLSQAARKYFTQSLDGAIASVWANTFTVTAKVLALIGQGLELRRRWLVKQLFASTADRAWLIRHGFELGLQPDPATSAIGSATGPTASGVLIPAGLQYARGSGAVFNGAAPITTGGTSVSHTLAADAAGAAGNTTAGTSLTLVDPDDAPVGSPTTLTVDVAPDGSGLSGGADEQDLEAFRAQVLYRKRNPPQGGSAADYAEWVLEAVPAARHVYVDSYQNDARAVWLQFTVLNLPAGVDGSDQTAVLAAFLADPTIIIPTAGQIAAAQAYVSDPIRRPVTARVFVTPPTPVPVAVTVAGLTPGTADAQTAARLEVAATFLDRAQPGTPSVPFKLSQSWIDEAVSRATGEVSHDLLSPATDLAFTAGQIPVPGAITFQ